MRAAGRRFKYPKVLLVCRLVTRTEKREMLVSVTQHPSTGSTRRAATELVGIYYASAARLFRKKVRCCSFTGFPKPFFAFFAAAQELAVEKFQEQAGWMSFTIW